MLKEHPALESVWPQNKHTEKWVGVYGTILSSNTPIAVRAVAGSLHNRRQHNANPSGLSDLTRTYKQMSNSNFSRQQEMIRLGPTPDRICPDRAYLLTTEQVWKGFYESAYDPGLEVKAATTKDKVDLLVCFLICFGGVVTTSLRTCFFTRVLAYLPQHQHPR